jgi:hypothetical protein
MRSGMLYVFKWSSIPMVGLMAALLLAGPRPADAQMGPAT